MNDELGLGKVTKKVFERSVLPYIPVYNPIELDGATINVPQRIVIAHSPSIGVPVEALGFFAFHYAASNVASRFGKPIQMIIGIYLPLKTSEKDLQLIAKTIGDEARKYGVYIVAGQTATYYGIEIPLLTATCIGEELFKPRIPVDGDHIIIVGDVGGEAVWLDSLQKGKYDEIWRKFTPLPVILSLSNLREIKCMHDVSEGGVKGALFEIADAYNIRVEVYSDKFKYAKGITQLNEDYLRVPSYGTLIAIVSEKNIETVKSKCSIMGYSFSDVGVIRNGCGLYVDEVLVKEQKRGQTDEIYGSFTNNQI